MIIGGAALPQALAKQALEAGIDILIGYGMSETCPVLTLAHLKPHMEAWGIDRQFEVRCKTGRPLPVQIRVVDAEKGVISKYGVPERVVFVDALPKTSVGKLDKKVLTVLK